MVPRREVDVSQLAQDVVDAWGTVMQGGKGAALSADFKVLFEKACAYLAAKKIADDNHREHGRLTQEEAEQEQRTKTEFLNAYLPVARMALRWCEERV
jgi:hypothetical protein